MAKSSKTKKPAKKAETTRLRRIRRRLGRVVLLVVGLWLIWILAYGLIRPPTTPYIVAEGMRLGQIKRTWVRYEDIAPVVMRSVVAAEDANFCLHWGIDMNALRTAIADGGQRGASTISQQTVKNTYLWHGRSYPRKALEGLMTPLIELFWTKRRILEVYLNVIEFDKGVFGIEAAAQHYFGVPASKLTPRQAGLLAAILPDPKGRSASKPTAFVRKRGAQVQDGAETIRADGRSKCFED